MKQTLWASTVLIGLAPLNLSAQSVSVLGQFILNESRIDGEKIGEFSALVPDPNGSGVLAISDRGYIARLEIGIVDDRLTDVTPVSLQVLKAKDGTAMRDLDFNPEGAALLDDFTVAIVSEDGPRIEVFDLQGNWVREEVLPAQLRDAAQQASKKDGPEALAWTENSGIISMTEEPQIGNARDQHTIYSTLQKPVVFSSAGSDDVSVKGMETVGDRLILLERSRDDATRAAQPWLRFVDMKTCAGLDLCKTRQVPVAVEGLADADFEGIVALDDNMFMIVSDDKIDGELRSAFVLFRLEE